MSISVPLPGPLIGARFVARKNRFLLQVRLEDTGQEVDAHMADPGRLRELLLPEKRVWIRPSSNPNRKTQWSAVLVEAPGGEGLVSLDSTQPNRLISVGLREGALPELGDWSLVRSEVAMGRSRFDFLLSGTEDRQMVLEVKSVTLVEGDVAYFPDAVTARGARHVRELAEISRRRGWAAGVLFVLQREDAGEIRAAEWIDPEFAGSLREAVESGVGVFGRRCGVAMDHLELGQPIPVTIG